MEEGDEIMEKYFDRYTGMNTKNIVFRCGIAKVEDKWKVWYLTKRGIMFVYDKQAVHDYIFIVMFILVVCAAIVAKVFLIKYGCSFSFI